MITQMQELVRRVNEALDEPWNKHIGRPKSLGLYEAVEAACMYLRQNATQEFIGDARDTSQPTISRYTAALVPTVKSVLEEFVPDAAETIEMVRGRVVLVDGTLTWRTSMRPGSGWPGGWPGCIPRRLASSSWSPCTASGAGRAWTRPGCCRPSPGSPAMTPGRPAMAMTAWPGTPCAVLTCSGS